MKARWLIVILAITIGCYFYPNQALLMALADEPGQTFFSNPQPRYLGFSDDRTEFVLKKAFSDGGFEIAPDGSALICPGIPANGMHGYILRLDVDSVMGDSAIATLVKTCVSDPGRCPSGSDSCITLNSGVSVMTTNFLLVRRAGKWTLAKPVSGGAVITG